MYEMYVMCTMYAMSIVYVIHVMYVTHVMVVCAPALAPFSTSSCEPSEANLNQKKKGEVETG